MAWFLKIYQSLITTNLSIKKAQAQTRSSLSATLSYAWAVYPGAFAGRFAATFFFAGFALANKTFGSSACLPRLGRGW